VLAKKIVLAKMKQIVTFCFLVENLSGLRTPEKPLEHPYPTAKALKT